jgi:hypothetical protein
MDGSDTYFYEYFSQDSAYSTAVRIINGHVRKGLTDPNEIRLAIIKDANERKKGNKFSPSYAQLISAIARDRASFESIAKLLVNREIAGF